MVEVREYLDASGRSPYAAWFDRLNRDAASKVVAALVRIRQGNFSNANGVYIHDEYDLHTLKYFRDTTILIL
jgi:hypothetical protein